MWQRAMRGSRLRPADPPAGRRHRMSGPPGPRVHEHMAKLEEKEKTRRIIGACLLSLGILCILWADSSDNAVVLQFGKTTAVVGTVLYFLGRIGKLLRIRD